MLESFADRLKFLMERRRVTYQKVGDGIGRSAQAVHKWANGGNIDNRNLSRLAAFFEVSPAWLRFGEPRLGEPFAHYGAETGSDRALHEVEIVGVIEAKSDDR